MPEEARMMSIGKGDLTNAEFDELLGKGASNRINMGGDYLTESDVNAVTTAPFLFRQEEGILDADIVNKIRGNTNAGRFSSGKSTVFDSQDKAVEYLFDEANKIYKPKSKYSQYLPFKKGGSTDDYIEIDIPEEEIQKYMSEVSPNDFMVKNSVFIRPIDASGQPVIDFTFTDKEGKNHKIEFPTSLVMGAQGDALMNNLNNEFQLLNKAQFGKGYFAQMQQFGAATIIPGVTIHELPAEIKVNGVNLGADEKIVTISNKAYKMKSYDDMVTLYTKLNELKQQGLISEEAKLFADTYLSSGGFEAVPGLNKYLQRGVKDRKSVV
jgi:hypothetical protein